MSDARSSATVGGVAVISGEVAGWLARLCGDWRREAVRLGCPPSMLAEVGQAIADLYAAAADQPVFLGESEKGQGKRGAPGSEAWITTSEAAQLLGLTRQRVGQLVAAGVLPASREREGGRLRLALSRVLAYRDRERRAA